nr:histone H2A deubiquitinase MYSM1-like [Onthophagus taurus]
MAEEDEIDILGDCSLDSFMSNNDSIFNNATNNSDELLKCDDLLVSQNTELLKCDYTIHPQWLLDKPSTNPACWYNNSESSNLMNTSLEDVDLPVKSDAQQIVIENSVIDKSGWTEKEKDLLKRGIEIFGKSHVRLSQFIGSKSPGEVKSYLKRFYLESTGLKDEIILECLEESIIDNGNDMEIVENKEVLTENEIPASIEEVIAAVSTANPTVKITKPKKKYSKLNINYKDIPSGHSLLKKNYIIPNNNSLKEKNKTKSDRSKKEKNDKKVKFKFKTKVIVPKNVAVGVKRIRTSRKSTRSDTENSLTSEASISDIEIVTGNGLSVPVCNGEEVIKIKKEGNESDSDIEIDVEDSEEDEKKEEIGQVKKKEKELSFPIERQEPKKDVEFDANKEENIKKRIPDLSTLNEDDVNTLMKMEFPSSEFLIDESTITNLERFIHFEFFEGRSTKTPSRYLKIRNHILNVWKTSKPCYVTKTSIRQGLKQCGDVNCISRVHQFLEQIGAINFKCPQTSYVRPLYEMVLTAVNLPKDTNREVENNFVVPQKLDNYYRNRNKKKFVNDGEGGYTLQHDDKGEVINTTVVNEDPIQKKHYIKKPIIRLIYCRPFTENNPQEYQVTITLSNLILMDLHSHSSLSEIMGLVGGRWNPTKKTLKILRYEPCKNLAPSSSTHCDMCPVSQAKAAENIHRDHMDVLGWFHSHPTFAPEPSQQDIDTQFSIQQCFGEDKPCVGVIMSPFSSHGALIASPFRCMIVGKKENFDDQFVPYKLKVDIDYERLDVEEMLNYAWAVFNSDSFGNGSSRVDFLKPYFHDTSITYLDKFISSIKMHLAKCTNINKMTCDAVQQGLSNILCNRV